MNQRIKTLREQSINAVNCISSERAQLITRFYKSNEARGLSTPMQRAKCFEYILANKEICINSLELIVGERGPAPKATPTYPEITVHSLSDLDILNSREKVSFKVDDQTRKIYEEEIIPFWKGKSNRDRVMANMSGEWLQAYEAGIFTEFQEQRAPGHTVAGNQVFDKGMLDFKTEIDVSIAKLDYRTDPHAFDKKEELEAMHIAAKALINWAARHADKLEKIAGNENDETRKAELLEMARICRTVPAHAPTTFHEALQHYWFIHLGVVTELNPWDSFNPGRLDRHLYPFYKRETENGTLTREKAVELLQSFWIKFNNHPSPPKIGVTAQESNTYTDFALINLGGLNPDGTDAVNELTFVILDVIEEMRLLQPSSMIQVSKKNPDSFIHRTLKILKTGFGQPSVFNIDAIIQELTRQGKSIIDARNGGASGCVESGAFGTEAYFLTGYFNIPKVIEITLYNGTDPLTSKTIGLQTGEPDSFRSFSDFVEAFKLQMNYFIDIKIDGNNRIDQVFSRFMPVPFLSVITNDCIKNGLDYVAGGARYNTSYIQGVGIGTVTDCLASIETNVFNKKKLTLSELVANLNANFYDDEALRFDLLYNTPKYGNDDDEADQHIQTIFDIYFEAIDGKPNARGGVHRVNLLPTTCHVYFGSVTGATPDGRLAGTPVSEGVSPVQGADINGPTAVLKSVAKIDHLRTGGTLLNQKFTPAFFENDLAISKLTSLIRSYFRLDGHHIQFNVVNAETLRKAQKNPENYRDLIVRVAGYSDYFNDLGEALQNEIIERTAHEEVG
ncbi:MAG: glycyl radical protein [Prolixibacteraceae bacterium]|jgi:pyruvate formate-lyase/glycerol dehydratase family glycyl radical enzyme|nr:glycyl radical protein [Prolixibacteraceae bacterium]